MPQQRSRRNDKRRQELLQAALGYAEAGIPVFPVHSINGRGVCTCGRKCSSPGKHPRTKQGHLEATRDEAKIRAWWTRWKNANIGGALGDKFVAIDVDVKKDNTGYDSLRALQDECGGFPKTATVKSGEYEDRRGRHFLSLIHI